VTLAHRLPTSVGLAPTTTPEPVRANTTPEPVRPTTPEPVRVTTTSEPLRATQLYYYLWIVIWMFEKSLWALWNVKKVLQEKH